MKPLKNGLNFANWLMRISLIILVVVIFWKGATDFNLSSKIFYISLAFVVFSILLFVGGFLSKPTLTVISGLILCSLSIYKIVQQFSGDMSNILANFIMIAAVGLYFACAGNNA